MDVAQVTVPYAEVTALMRAAKEKEAELLRQVRAAVNYLRDHHGYSLKTFADEKLTDLHKNSILRLKDPDWIPNPKTMEKLTRLIREAEIKRAGKKGSVDIIPRGRPVTNGKGAASRSPRPTRAARPAPAVEKPKTTKRGLAASRRKGK